MGQPATRSAICTWEQGLKYYHLSGEKPSPIVAHSFIADGVVSATIWDFSENRAKKFTV